MNKLIKFFPFCDAKESIFRFTVTFAVCMAVMFLAGLTFAILRTPLGDKAYIAGIACGVVGAYALAGGIITILHFFKK